MKCPTVKQKATITCATENTNYNQPVCNKLHDLVQAAGEKMLDRDRKLEQESIIDLCKWET